MISVAKEIDRKIFRHVGDVADSMARECYVVGGFVRDIFLNRPSKDIDFVTIGSGIEVAEAVTATLGRGAHLAVYRNFGTASIHYRGEEIEFVGARKESYRADSRKPIVEDGTLTDDLSRRDLTINALAISVNAATFGNLIDLFGGLDDLRDRLIRTPLDPDITFSDDPLRMMRAIRFATQLDFTIVPSTLEAIARNASRLEIISRERIADELQKIMKSPRPSIGCRLLSQTRLLPLILPELEAMKGVETVKGRG
ncbi:MAG: CCA tRNA nucleotidyltransferase, partial [Muribaculaceae bacterium]|nr:CCA tRNA nucleotidyltransferase [Muribaculaceae bacterium]